MRVTGVTFFSLYVTFGFSPRANFMPMAGSRIMSSMRRPTVLRAAHWPPMALALPGPVSTVVTPLCRASAKVRSRGFRASMACS